MANNFDAYNPAHWANETVAVLSENMVAANLVHRDFESTFAKKGDTVNTRKPRDFNAVRKAKETNISTQDAIADNIPVVLNQHVYVSFDVNDIDKEFSFKQIIDEFIRPAAISLARFADRVVIGQAARFFEAGRIVGGSSFDTYENLVDAKVQMDNQLAFVDGRRMLMSPKSHGRLLKNKELFPVDKAGTTDVVRRAMLGQLADFDLYSVQNMMNVPISTIASSVGSQTLTAAAAKGTTALTVSGAPTPAIAANQTVIVNGVPYIVASTGSTTTLVLSTPLITDVAAGTTVWFINRANIVTARSAGYEEAIDFSTSGTIPVPPVGSMIQIASKWYVVVGAGAVANTFFLDRPLEDAVGANTLVNIAYGVSTNFGFHRNAMTAAIRPLAPVPERMGVGSFTAAHAGHTVRATMGYNMTTQNTQVTLDFLMGVKVLDNLLGTVLFT